MSTLTRQPFGELGSSRLQTLQSTKNKQHASASTATFASPLKPSPVASTGKRQRAPEIFEDDSSENIDPSLFRSPSKKSRTLSEAGFIKPAPVSLFTSPPKPSISLNTSPTILSVRKALSSSNTAKSTPISASRGSPKNKRVHAISKRRASSSPFRRVDPPSFAQNNSRSALPFSIDAALSGSIPNYTPKTTSAAATPASAHQHVSISIEETMPRAWFFEIHEDTPEQEAANLMEHSASVLDISSDDDVDTKKRSEELSRGKENVPPPEWAVAQQARLMQPSVSDEQPESQNDEMTKRLRLRQFAQDAMDEDRKPLGDLPPCDFYAEGCDASSYVTVDAGIERPSGLSRECDFSIASDSQVELENEKEEVELDAEPHAEVSDKAAEVVKSPSTPQDDSIIATPLPSPQEGLNHVDIEAVPRAQEILPVDS